MNKLKVLNNNLQVNKISKSFGNKQVVRNLSLNINNLPGVVEHGLFIGLCDEVFVGKSNGAVDVHSNKTKASFSYKIDLDEMSLVKSMIEGK